VFWQLISQGVLTPGMNTANPNLPWFRLTQYGKKVIQEKRFLPHDPTNYMKSFRVEVSNPDPIVISYLEESLNCFSSGCFIASTFMLGIASEVTFLNLCTILLSALKDTTEHKQFTKIMDKISMISKFNFVRDKIEKILKSSSNGLPEDVIISLLSIFELIRKQRNDLGHPQNIPIITRDEVFVFLRMFPHYCKTVQSLETYLKHNKI
jgi:hypothetical protein